MARSVPLHMASNHYSRYRETTATGKRCFMFLEISFLKFLRPQATPRPYSDAYISGMSSKRRKVFQNRKPSTNIQQQVAEGVRQAISSAKRPASTSSSSSANRAPPTDEIVSAITNDPAVLTAYRDEVKSNASQRLKTDPDYDKNKHPHCSDAFK